VLLEIDTHTRTHPAKNAARGGKSDKSGMLVSHSLLAFLPRYIKSKAHSLFSFRLAEFLIAPKDTLSVF